MSSAVLKLLKIAEAADRLGISAKHLRRDILNAGLLEVIHLGRSAKGDSIDPADLDRFIKSRRGVCRSTKETVFIGTSSKSTSERLDALLGPLPKERPRKSSAKPSDKPRRTFMPDEAASLSRIPLVMP